MGKKKNRKKQLKLEGKKLEKAYKQQKVEHGLPDTPTRYVEKRYMEPLLPFYRALLQIEEEKGDFLDDSSIVLEQVSQGTFPFSKINQLLEKIYQAKDVHIIQRLANQILQIDPQQLEALYILETLQDDVADQGKLQNLKVLHYRALQEWSKVGYEDWNILSARLPLGVLGFVIDRYLVYGYDGLAVELVDFVRSKGLKRHLPNFPILVMSAYNRTYRFKELEGFYLSMERVGKASDGMLLQYAIAQYLHGDFEEAIKSMERLERENPAVSELFSQDNWVDLVDDIRNQVLVEVNSLDSLRNALYPILDCILIHEDLTYFLEERYFSSFDEKLFLRKDFQVLANMMAFVREYKIGFDKARIIWHAGIESASDFEEWTEKEFLAIKGIGPATLEKLKEAGVKFKG